MKKPSLMTRQIFLNAIKDSFIKLNPKTQIQNPVIFLTLLAALFTTFAARSSFDLQISVWLWFTVLFANFSEAVAEGRGKAQADSLRKTRTLTQARLKTSSGERKVNASELKRGDVVICESNDVIPGDGEVIAGIATVDESAITGESAPVIRESGGDRCAVTGGTRVLSDRIEIEITAEPGHGFIDRMIKLVEGAERKKTPNEIALSLVLIALTLIFILGVATLKIYSDFAAGSNGQDLSQIVTFPVLVALLICLIPTTIGGLLSAIGISGIDRLIQKNVIAMSGRAVEAAGDIDVLLLDKTGTITLGNRVAAEFIPAKGLAVETLAAYAQLASLSDETPEGRSVVVLAKDKYQLRADQYSPQNIKFVPFTAQTRMSGVDIQDQGKLLQVRKGAAESIDKHVRALNGQTPIDVNEAAAQIANLGGTPLVVSLNESVLGVIYLKDQVKGGIRERFAELRKMGIRTVMITGDNPLTAAAIAAEAGVDDYIAQATPESKLARIREEQQKGHMVAMTGDGTNDAPALAQADVGVAMNTGTQAAREAGNMVDLDSNPTKLIEIVETGKQLLMTRGALTTFSIANDVAKYFAILPAMFSSLYATQVAAGVYRNDGPLSRLNLMNLHSPQSAILSAVIFNALIIVALVPLALRGVQYRPVGADRLLRDNLLVYGVGGIIAPFIGIKLIDVLLTHLGVV